MSDYFERWADDMCELIAQIAQEEFKEGTPEYTFQQTMISAANSYQRSKAAKNED